MNSWQSGQNRTILKAPWTAAFSASQSHSWTNWPTPIFVHDDRLNKTRLDGSPQRSPDSPGFTDEHNDVWEARAALLMPRCSSAPLPPSDTTNQRLFCLRHVSDAAIRPDWHPGTQRGVPCTFWLVRAVVGGSSGRSSVIVNKQCSCLSSAGLEPKLCLCN